MQRAQVDVDLDLAAELEVALRVHIAADFDGGHVEEVERALEFELEHRVNHAHAAPEVHIEQEDVDLAAQLHVEHGVGLDHIALQRGVVQGAGVDAQRCLSLNVEDRDVHARAEIQVQRKEGRIVGVQADGGRALDLDLAEGRQVQHHLHGQLHALAVDQEVDRALHADRADLDLGFAGDAQRLRRQVDDDRLFSHRVEEVAFGIAATRFLRHRGGVDLQQEAAGDAESAATVQNNGLLPGAADLQATVQARAALVDDQAQGAGGCQLGQRLELELGGHANFHAEAGLALAVLGEGRNDREITPEVEQPHQAHIAFAGQRDIGASPSGLDVFLAGRVLHDGELHAGHVLVVVVDLDDVQEGLGHGVVDPLAKAVEVEFELGPELGDLQIEVHAHGHAHGHAAGIDDQQTGGLALEAKVIGANLHRHIGKGGQAFLLAEPEVDGTVELDQVEQIDLQDTVDAQEGGVVVEHDGLVRVARFNGIARRNRRSIEHAIGHILARVQATVLVEVFNELEHAVATVLAEIKHAIAVDVFARAFPGALAEVDGGQGKAGLDVGLEGDVGLSGFPKLLFSVSGQLGRIKVCRQVDRKAGDAAELPKLAVGRAHQLTFSHRGQAPACVVVPVLDDLADVQREACAQIDLQGDVARLHDHARDTVQADLVDRRPTGQVDTDADPLYRDIGFSGDQQAQVQVFNDHADGALVDIIGLVDAVIAIAVVEVTAWLAIDHGGNAQEGIGIVDADGHGGDDGLLTIGQRDLFARALGKRHGGRHLQHTAQVDLGVAHLGLDDFFIKVDEDHVVATGRQGKACAIDFAVLVAVLAELQNAVVVFVFARIQAQIGVGVFAKIKYAVRLVLTLIELAVVVQVFTRIEDAVAAHIFGKELEGLAFLEVDGRRAKELKRQIHRRWRLGNQEGVDIDLNIAQLGRQNRLVDAHQPGALNAGLGR